VPLLRGGEIVKDVDAANIVWNPYGVKFVVLNIRNFNGTTDFPVKGATFNEEDPDLSCPKSDKMLLLAQYLKRHPEISPPKEANSVIVVYSGGTFKPADDGKGRPLYTIACTFANFITQSPGAAIFITRPPIPKDPTADRYKLTLAHELGHVLINIDSNGKQIPSPVRPIKGNEIHTSLKNNLMNSLVPYKSGLVGAQIARARNSILINICERNAPLLKIGRVNQPKHKISH
jgi:hypothetical protein